MDTQYRYIGFCVNQNRILFSSVASDLESSIHCIMSRLPKSVFQFEALYKSIRFIRQTLQDKRQYVCVDNNSKDRYLNYRILSYEIHPSLQGVDIWYSLIIHQQGTIRGTFLTYRRFLLDEFIQQNVKLTNNQTHLYISNELYKTKKVEVNHRGVHLVYQLFISDIDS